MLPQGETWIWTEKRSTIFSAGPEVYPHQSQRW